jgi:hypothetical protein
VPSAVHALVATVATEHWAEEEEEMRMEVRLEVRLEVRMEVRLEVRLVQPLRHPACARWVERTLRSERHAAS